MLFSAITFLRPKGSQKSYPAIIQKILYNITKVTKFFKNILNALIDLDIFSNPIRQSDFILNALIDLDIFSNPIRQSDFLNKK